MQIDFGLFNKVLLALINLIGLVVATSVYGSDTKKKTNLLFFIWVILMFVWIDLDFFSAFASYIFPEDSIAILATLSSRASWFFVCLYLMSTYFFVKSFPVESSETKISKFHDVFYVSIWSFWAILSFTPWVVSDVSLAKGIALQNGGILQIPILVFVAISVIHYFYIMFKKYLQSGHDDKTKLRYFFIGAGIYALMILIFNIIMPILAGGQYQGFYYIYGEYSSLIFLFFVAYSIMRNQLFGIRVLAVQFLVVLMGALLFFVPFFVAEIGWLKIITWLAFGLFCIIGYLLIKSTSSETAEKGALEKELNTRIIELEKAKKSLEEAKLVLEVRVQARTKELQEQATKLDQQVKVRTVELEKKVEELERSNKLMVGREMAMLELKQELAKYKAFAQKDK